MIRRLVSFRTLSQLSKLFHSTAKATTAKNVINSETITSNEIQPTIGQESNNNNDSKAIVDSECWNCNSRSFQANLLACGSCKHLQDPSESILTMNYFRLFNMSYSYQIDQSELGRRYKDLQKTFHPDRFYTLRNPKIIQFSETYSTYINEAFSTLKNDLKRGEYLINLLSGGKGEDLENKVDSDIVNLQEVMIVRMQIEESESDEELAGIQEHLLKEETKLSKRIESTLHSKDFSKAAAYLIRMRYNQSSLNSIKQRSETLLFLK